MTRSLALSLLRQGTSGDEILQILETLAADAEEGTVTAADGTPLIW
jgi:hypothetical protein